MRPLLDRAPNFADLLDADPDDPAFGPRCAATNGSAVRSATAPFRTQSAAVSAAPSRLASAGPSRNASATAGDAGGGKFRKRELRACHRNGRALQSNGI